MAGEDELQGDGRRAMMAGEDEQQILAQVWAGARTAARLPTREFDDKSGRDFSLSTLALG